MIPDVLFDTGRWFANTMRRQTSLFSPGTRTAGFCFYKALYVMLAIQVTAWVHALPEPAASRNPCKTVHSNSTANVCISTMGPTGSDVCCCSVSNSWGCFPSLFIPGAQKAGTSALSALISFIDGVTIPKVKELHALNDPAFGEQGYMSYLSALGGSPRDVGRGLFTYDTTPAYMLLRSTIQQMSSIAPTARIIVMVRC